jgi:hypothetical protein
MFNSSQITDSSGTPLSSTSPLSFLSLLGDASGNGVVDSIDFDLFLASYGKSSQAFSHGKVNSQDFNLLAGRFGVLLPNEGDEG